MQLSIVVGAGHDEETLARLYLAYRYPGAICRSNGEFPTFCCIVLTVVGIAVEAAHG
jgi:hypothetical protein